MSDKLRKFIPILITFLIISIMIKVLEQTMESFNIDATLLNAANCILLLLSIVSTMIQSRSLKNPNPNVFVRSVMGGMMIKMFLSVIAVIIYVYSSGNSFNKRGIMISMFLYLIYLGTEVYTMIKMNKNKNA